MEGKDETRTEKKTNSHDFMRGNGSDARTGGIDSRAKILIKNVVTIVSSNEATDGKSHTLAEQTGRDVAKVAAGHTDYRTTRQYRSKLFALAKACLHLLYPLGIGIEIVERLRQETGHVDRIGTS